MDFDKNNDRDMRQGVGKFSDSVSLNKAVMQIKVLTILNIYSMEVVNGF